MRRRVGLQNKALRPPRLLLGEIAQTHAAAGAERLGIVQYLMHLLVSRHAIDAPFVEIDDGARLAELLMGRKRIGEELDSERIEIEMRNTGSLLRRHRGCGHLRVSCMQRALPDLPALPHRIRRHRWPASRS